MLHRKIFQPTTAVCENNSSRRHRLIAAASFTTVIVNPDLRQTIAQGISREAEQPRRLRLITACPFQRFSDHFIFPLVERHAVGQEMELPLA